MQKRLIAHVDMDCFYAACEIKKTPSLAGFPLIIGADRNSPRGVVCTASYEARRFGVKSAMPISQAVRLCPNGIFLRPNFSLYGELSQQVMEILQSHASSFEQLSVDEANLDITELATQFSSLLDVGKFLRQEIFQKTGLTCSVGIAPSRKVAKIAAGYKKPHGVTVVYNMKNFLAPMKIGAIPGIGKKSVPHFESLGVKTVGDLARKDKFFVLEKLGQVGFEHWLLANGADYSVIVPRGEEKSYSREETFMSDLTDKVVISQNLTQLSNEVFKDVGNCSFKTVTLKVRYDNFATITRSISLKFACNCIMQLHEAVAQLAKINIDYSRPIRLLGVKLSNLSHCAAVQTSLCDFSNISSVDPELDSSLSEDITALGSLPISTNSQITIQLTSA